MRPPPTRSRPTTAPPPSSAAALPSSPWHSPVPYLFGGLAAMLALITLALLILACSYWKLNNYLGTGDTAAASSSSSSSAPAATDGDDGSKSPAATAAASPATVADLVAVVMAGEKTPTFLAAPVVRQARGSYGEEQHADAAAAGESPEDQEKNRSATGGGGESGVVAGYERDRQLDHV